MAAALPMTAAPAPAVIGKAAAISNRPHRLCRGHCTIDDSGEHLLVVVPVSLQSFPSAARYRLPVYVIREQPATHGGAFLGGAPEHRLSPLIVERDVFSRALGTE